MADVVEKYHDYFAEATALSGFLRLPFERTIAPRSGVELSGRKGGYEAKQEREFHLESAISYRAAHTQVAGNRALKTGHGWSTLATAVVEGLNVLDVVTADRIVAQIATEHPAEGYVPSVTFLGTRFENLRIAGHRVRLNSNLNLFGEKPANDALYTADKGFMERVAQQRGHFLAQMSEPKEVTEGYNRVPSGDGGAEGVECSLVNSVAPVETTAWAFPGRCFGHAIEVPNFGVIYLATVRLVESEPHPKTGIPMRTTIGLKMLDIRMGCVADGGVGAGQVVGSGTSHP